MPDIPVTEDDADDRPAGGDSPRRPGGVSSDSAPAAAARHDVRVPIAMDDLPLDPLPKPTSVLAHVIAVVVFLPLGIMAWRQEVLARRSGDDRARRLHHQARARGLVLYSYGAAFALAVVAVLFWLFAIDSFALAKEYFNPNNLRESIPDILRAFRYNLWISVVAFATSLVWALILVVVRGLPGAAAAPLRAMAIAYVDICRGLPSLLIILLVAFGLPRTGLPIVSDMSIYASGILAITVLYGALISETLRAGMDSVHHSQVQSARAIGLTHLQTLRFVVVPQGLMRTVPPLISWYISLLKETSLLSVVGLLEGVNIAQIQVANQSNLTPLSGIALCFLVVTLPLSRAADYLVRRLNRTWRGGGES